MSIYYDNFETYGTVTVTPFGSFTGGGATIISTNYVTTGSRAVFVNGDTQSGQNAIYHDGSLYSSVTVWCAFKLPETGSGQTTNALVAFWNGTSINNEVLQIHPESDFSLSARARGTVGNNSGNFRLHKNTWYFMQVNATIFDAGGLVASAYDVAIEGTSVLSGTLTSTITTTNTPSMTAQWDQLILANIAYFDEFTLSTQTTIGTYPNLGTPKARVSTGLIEVVRLNSDANIRATTGLIELVISQHGWEVKEA